jgi:hypothetical protein
VDVGSSLPADAQAAVLVKPAERALDDPACRVRKFGRTSQKRPFAGKTEFASSLHQVVAGAVPI